MITSALIASGTAGTAFSYQIAATNGPTSFNATPLPAGLSVNTSNGLISGTPAAAGTASVTISATNAGGTGTAALSLTINAVPAPPDAAPKLNTVLAYPNPAVKQDTVIRAMVGVVNGVEITIFDMSGRVVHSGSVAGTPTGIANGQYYYDYTWTGSKASGVYFAVIHGKAADGTVIRARVRFAVIQ